MNKNSKTICFARGKAEGQLYNGIVRDNAFFVVDGNPLKGKLTSMRLSFPLDRMSLLPPLDFKQIWCIGKNYVGHIKELKTTKDTNIPKEPIVFLKSANTLVGSGGFIRIPRWAGAIHYEGELALVIGKEGKNIKEANALDYVLGYTILNDVTARDLQAKDGQWTRCKNFDTFAPVGPGILLTKELPSNTKLETRVNGKTMQSVTLDQMIFSIPRLIAHISHFTTLHAGDIISTGTPEGIGPIRPGDMVEVEISGIGILKNPCTGD